MRISLSTLILALANLCTYRYISLAIDKKLSVDLKLMGMDIYSKLDCIQEQVEDSEELKILTLIDSAGVIDKIYNSDHDETKYNGLNTAINNKVVFVLVYIIFKQPEKCSKVNIDGKEVVADRALAISVSDKGIIPSEEDIDILFHVGCSDGTIKNLDKDKVKDIELFSVTNDIIMKTTAIALEEYKKYVEGAKGSAKGGAGDNTKEGFEPLKLDLKDIRDGKKVTPAVQISQGKDDFGTEYTITKKGDAITCICDSGSSGGKVLYKSDGDEGVVSVVYNIYVKPCTVEIGGRLSLTANAVIEITAKNDVNGPDTETNIWKDCFYLSSSTKDWKLLDHNHYMKFKNREFAAFQTPQPRKVRGQTEEDDYEVPEDKTTTHDETDKGTKGNEDYASTIIITVIILLIVVILVAAIVVMFRRT